MQPLAHGSLSLRLYPHLELPPPRIVEELVTQAQRAMASGFDGTMVSEHHNGFAGYLPNPIQAAGWVLESTDTGWSAPCPLLLPLRPTALVAEEVAWMAARFPGRVALGVAAGSLEDDFSVMGTNKEALADRFTQALAELSAMLLGRDAGRLAGDVAVARCAEAPVPLVSAAMSRAAVRRSALHGVGLLFDSLSDVARCRELVDLYSSAGGTGPVALIRRVWVGPSPSELLQRQRAVYESYAPAGAMAHWKGDQMAGGASPVEVAEQLVAQAEAAGASCLNLRVHVPGVAPEAVRDQIDALAEVCTQLRHRWPGSGPAAPLQT